MGRLSAFTAIVIALTISACTSKGPVRAYPGAIYEFSDDQPTRIEVDINNILFNEICLHPLNKDGSSAGVPPAECLRLNSNFIPAASGQSPTRSTAGAPSKRGGPKTRPAPPAPEPQLQLQTLGVDGNRVFSDLILALEGLPAERKLLIRNTAAHQLIFASEHACRNYLFTLVGTQNNTRFGTEVFAGVASTAASLTDATDPSNLYSALSALAIMGSASLDRNYFANQAVEVIRLAIDKNRAKKREALRKKLTASYDEYPFGIAMADIVQFHSSCSLMEGLAETKEAIIDREMAIRGARNIAARLHDTGADGRQIVAALTGLEESHFGLPSDDVGLTVSSEIAGGISKAETVLTTALEPAKATEAAEVDKIAQTATTFCDSPQGKATPIACEMAKSLEKTWYEEVKKKLKPPVANETEEAKKERQSANSATFTSELQQQLASYKLEMTTRRQLAESLLRVLATPNLSQDRFDELKITETFLFANTLSSDPAIAAAQLALRNQPGATELNKDVKRVQPAAKRALEVFKVYLKSES